MPQSSAHDVRVVIPENEEGTPSRQQTTVQSATPSDRWSGSRLGESHVAYLDLAEEVERRRKAGEDFSPVYRIYLRDEGGVVMAGYTVAVDSDAEALRVAAILCHACKDATAKFEVWKGEIMLAFDGSDAKPATRLSQQFQYIATDQPGCRARRAQ